MVNLPDVLEAVRKKIARYQGKQINEQNTKTALIQPVLEALGWDVGNLEEVQQEYKRRPRDKPVDYALLLLRTPRLFVEAKALGQDLSDRKWANQIMGYATVAGVEWVVITNGDEYRVYNACAAVPVEEKLFRAVKVTDHESPAEEILQLLSKDRMSENQIEILWNAHFVDRQVQAALEKVFSTVPDPSLVRLLSKRAKELSPPDIRASLGRLQVSFDFPVQPESAPPKRRGRAASEAAKKAWQTRRQTQDVTLVDLISAGILKPPLELVKEYKGQGFRAELCADGSVKYDGKTYESCSRAASVARSSVLGRRVETNGWQWWHYRDENDNLLKLDDARQRFLQHSSR